MDPLDDRPRVIGWAIVDLLGHRREAGFISEDSIAGARMLRLARPVQDPSTDETESVSFFPPASIYMLTPSSEHEVRDELYPGWNACGETYTERESDVERTCTLDRDHDGPHDDGLPF